jgi:hypothetical protein
MDDDEFSRGSMHVRKRKAASNSHTLRADVSDMHYNSDANTQERDHTCALLQSDAHFHAEVDAEDNADLYGMYDYPNDNASASEPREHATTKDMILQEMHLGSVEHEEAQWLRTTYENVYNPTARTRALQALTSDAAATTAESMESAPSQTQTRVGHSDDASFRKLSESPWKFPANFGADVGATASFSAACEHVSASQERDHDEAARKSAPAAASACMLDSDFGSCLLTDPQQVGAKRSEAPSKCTVLYDFV